MSVRVPTSVVTRARARPASRTLALALGELAAAALLAGAVELALLYPGDAGTPPWVVALFPVVSWIYVSAGVVAWLRRSSNTMGALMVAAGLAWLVAGLANTSVPALIAVGLIVATVPLAMVVHLLHAFPSGRLRGRLSRVTVVAGYFVCVVLQAPVYLFGPGSGPGTVLQISDRPDLDRIGFWIQTGAGAAVMAVTVVILGARLRDTPRTQRLVVGPLFGYGIFAVVFVVAAGSAKELFPWGTLELAALQLSLLALVPVAFAVAMVRGGFRRTWEIEELSAWLGEADGRRSLRDALARALGDPSVELLFWAANIESYVDGAGTRLELPATGSGRAAMEVLSADGRVGAIVYDAKLLADPGVVRAAARVIALALDRERLTAELRVSREGLRQSRARVVEAADSERRRIARDLHDGLQTRLILLAIAAERIRTDAPDGSAAAAEELQTGLQAAIGELRELVTGVVPAALTQGGLYAAAEDLADRAPIPIELTLEPAQTRLPAAVESTGYFVLSEALTNAFKHAGARELRVYLGQRNGHLRIEVHDDGVGGAELANGAGLRSMADRVEAHEGSLLIESSPVDGTRITVEVPCAS